VVQPILQLEQRTQWSRSSTNSPEPHTVQDLNSSTRSVVLSAIPKESAKTNRHAADTHGNSDGSGEDVEDGHSDGESVHSRGGDLRLIAMV
jgi:hypothetical protein